MLAAIRPDSWNFPLLVHVAGAMLLVGSLLVATIVTGAAARTGAGSGVLMRTGFRTLLVGVIPASIVMRIGAEWIADKEGLADSDDAWIGIGYGTADVRLVLLIIATVLAWRATKRGDAGPGMLGRSALILATLVLLFYGVAIWAMTTKPT